MTDSPNRGREERSGFGAREEQWGTSGGPGYSGYSDPAYASQAPYGSPYQPPQAPRPTERLPAYPPYGYDPYATGQYPPPHPQGFGSEPPPEGPKSPRWLWIVAGVAVVLVIGLVIALVIVNSSRQQTVVAPLPSQPEPSYTPSPTTTSRTPATRTPTTRPSTPALPLPTLPSSPTTPTEPTIPGATDTVVYTVEGTGRAINITYVDTGGLLQTEFNVMLPWSKEVSLPQPGETSASISIINVGREVTCSISVNGAQLDMRTGAGLTICTPEG
ncbi:MmpS family transport accessory protein [Mycolicibacterium sp. BiH015]|uniref:MmpS family transport accessory protein n=1 Tax=Mycolicibacterium sp. BiH015 TaxID=3018808 RepID=UPI0022E5E250|nr:MmpS family transport accessory protein [Mycolicibacterium sp. BiH015]MDA2893798.1 MmpS family transport accessory protein [Mycolicibacterium sp. BiH015]